jgi:hypothetical protein
VRVRQRALQNACKAGFLVGLDLQKHQCAVGMEPLMELSRSKAERCVEEAAATARGLISAGRPPQRRRQDGDRSASLPSHSTLAPWIIAKKSRSPWLSAWSSTLWPIVRAAS